MEQYHEQRKQTVKASEVDLYPHKYAITTSIAELRKNATNLKTASISGRVLKISVHSNFKFVHVYEEGVHLQLMMRAGDLLDKDSNYTYSHMERGDILGMAFGCHRE